MIVRNVEDGWEIIFQPAHGLLACQIGMHLGDRMRSQRWPGTLAAIADHDDDQADFSSGGKTYVSDVGVPRDFTQVAMTDQSRFDKTKSRLRNAYRKDRWVGLLTSYHADVLYGDKDLSKELRELLEEEKETRRRVLRQLKLKAAELKHAYDTLHWCDRCSLILCRDEIPAMGRRLEIVTTGDGTRYDIHSEGDYTTVDPWPFAAHDFTVGTDVYHLSKLEFTDDSTLDSALTDCVPTFREWRFRKL